MRLPRHGEDDMQEKEDDMVDTTLLHPYQRMAADMMMIGPDGVQHLQVRRSGRADGMALPGGFSGERLPDRDMLDREMFEETGFMPSMFGRSGHAYGARRIHMAVVAIAARHPDWGLRVDVETDRDLRTTLVVCAGEGTRDEIFAVRTLDEASDLLALVVMHLDAWMLSRRTVLAKDPGVMRYTPASVLDRPDQVLTADESHLMRGGRGSAKTGMLMSLVRRR